MRESGRGQFKMNDLLEWIRISIVTYEIKDYLAMFDYSISSDITNSSVTFSKSIPYKLHYVENCQSTEKLSLLSFS